MRMYTLCSVRTRTALLSLDWESGDKIKIAALVSYSPALFPCSSSHLASAKSHLEQSRKPHRDLSRGIPVIVFRRPSLKETARRRHLAQQCPSMQHCAGEHYAILHQDSVRKGETVPTVPVWRKCLLSETRRIPKKKKIVEVDAKTQQHGTYSVYSPEFSYI